MTSVIPMITGDPATIALKFGLYAILGALFGMPCFALYSRNIDRAGGIPQRRLLAGGAIIGLLLSGLGIAMLTASMMATPLSEVDLASLGMVVQLPGVGTAWMVRMAALGCVLVAALAVRPARYFVAAATLFGGIALASLAWTGHAMMSEGVTGKIHLASDIAHLLAGGAWVGALLMLVLLLSRTSGARAPIDPAGLHAALDGFAIAGTVIVGVLLITGLANIWTVIGVAAIWGLFASLYGWLFIGKLVLFCGMVALAATNRFRLTPALERAIETDTGEPIAALRRSIALETAAVMAILALVAWLGMLAPPFPGAAG